MQQEQTAGSNIRQKKSAFDHPYCYFDLLHDFLARTLLLRLSVSYSRVALERLEAFKAVQAVPHNIVLRTSSD